MGDLKASPEKITALVSVAIDIGVLSPCKACKGEGGLVDTTYNRSGEWGFCGHCNNTGLIYSGPKSIKAKSAQEAYLKSEASA